MPDNAGPLHTQRQLHETLAAMRETSPANLQRFLSHAEALLWLGPSIPTAAVTPKEGARANDRESGLRTPQRQRHRDGKTHQ